MLKPAQLRLLQAIAEHRQLQLAADACAMTQPAASRMLAETERLMGAKLFLRHPRGMVPTEIGQAVLRRIRVILREMRGIAAEVSAMQDGLAGSAHVGAVTGPAVGFLVSAVREIKQLAPEADITVDVLPSRELLARLAAGEMDFVLGRILPEFESREFTVLPMRDERVALLVREHHPLNRAASVTLTELHDHEWIMQQRGAPIREATRAAFAALGLNEPRNVVNSPSLLFTIAYLAQGNAVAPLSQEVAQLLTQPPVSAGFAALPVRHDIRVAPYYLLNLRRRPLSPLARKLRERVIAHAQDTAGGLWQRAPS
ncbi:LysR family transcriptional regulator [Paracoccus sp. (in: a-proteobacteria)]|uniref:LysR family transcriptional regulator n=1 Tax=Paracoccus sp. TaxID=267 RepID=UPI00321FABF8